MCSASHSDQPVAVTVLLREWVRLGPGFSARRRMAMRLAVVVWSCLAVGGRDL